MQRQREEKNEPEDICIGQEEASLEEGRALVESGRLSHAKQHDGSKTSVCHASKYEAAWKKPP